MPQAASLSLEPLATDGGSETVLLMADGAARGIWGAEASSRQLEVLRRFPLSRRFLAFPPNLASGQARTRPQSNRKLLLSGHWTEFDH